MNKQKLIGISGYKIGDNGFGIGLPYINFISKFGIPVIITPQHVDNIPKVDMLYLPGGLDVNPLTYGEIPNYYTQNPNILLEFFDDKILPQYIENKTPILCVCRSAQKIWGLYGGKINQHVTDHDQSDPGTEPAHYLEYVMDYQDYNSKLQIVTSRHHQCMHTPSDKLEVIAYAKEKISSKEYLTRKDIVEIFKVKDENIYGMQFHPEDHHERIDSLTPYIINKLLNDK